MKPVSPCPKPFQEADSAARRRLVLWALAGGPALTACGGGSSSGDVVLPAPPAPAPSPADPAPPQNPSPAVDGPAWRGFAGNPQHSALGAVATQDLNRIAWRTPVDLAPSYRLSGALLVHYGSPVVSTRNTVCVPVKTTPSGGFRVEARAGGNGVLLWQADSDYVLPPNSNWVPSWNPGLDPGNRLYAPAAGGRLLVRDNVDLAASPPRRVAFYGDTAYAAASARFDASVFINTPLTIDAAGTVYFGFIALAGNPAGLVSGVARVAADGSGSWISASAAASDPQIVKLATNSAPALSPDGLTLYVAVNDSTQHGYLLALDSRTLAARARRPLVEPGTTTSARINDDGTSSPTIGPDGDVYFGVLEANYGTHNARGWLLHFDATLNRTLLPGSFGWDDTVSIVPAAMVPSYVGSSSYLLMSKYNNYAGVGTGDGVNRIAVLDPRASQADAYSAQQVMREVLSIAGPTPEDGVPGGVKEWCINTAAVDPLTRCVLVNSEDGWLYRWDLTTNSFTQRIQLTSGLGEAYTPTAIGADGAVYAINNAVLFSIAR